MPDPSYTPNPDNPLPVPLPPSPLPGPIPLPGPVPLPGPIPFPQPGPMPLPPDHDWWRCWRNAAISGRYEGNQAGSALIGKSLDLRLDIDRRNNAESPVLNRISGDIYTKRFVRIGGRFQLVTTYLESWIVDKPVVTWSRCRVRISGTVRFWQGVHPPTTVDISVGWFFGGT